MGPTFSAAAPRPSPDAFFDGEPSPGAPDQPPQPDPSGRPWKQMFDAVTHFAALNGLHAAARRPGDLTAQAPKLANHLEGLAKRSDAAYALRSDPEFKYVNLRRYLAFLNESISKAIQFAVFEPNGEALWDNVRTAVSDFLFSEWQSGALPGARPEEAYFVKCDRSTMTQDDLDHGRLVLLVGVATVKPGEFVILRFSASTASASAGGEK
jgi:hypothetical protein